MSKSHEHAPAAHREQQRPAPAIEAPAPVTPVPLPVGTLSVGHAEDRAEHEADTMADTALARLQRLGGEVHQHGPGCDHVRRSPAPVPSGGTSTTPVVGHEGGALDAGTSNAIESRRGGGRPLESNVLQRMQTAFATDLGSVRVHDDASAARLSRAVSARAFTTGSDIFFGAGEYSPGTPSGERVLAHELAHTLQPAGALKRLGSYQWPDQTGPGRTVTPEVTPEGEAAGTAGGPEAGSGQAITTMKELLAAPNVVVRALLPQTSVAGPLRAILMGAFEGDWFKAKDCLVFGRWPGAKPKMDAETQLMLMTAFTALRVEVHKQVAAKTVPMVRFELAKRAKQLKGDAKLAGKLSTQKDGSGKQVEHFGPQGADTATSDVDVSSGGPNSELAVRTYNQQFRALLGTELDAGTVFDLNVYAKDFIFKEVRNESETTMKVTKENENEARDEQEQAHADEEQDVYALVHVARFMDAQQWDDYTTESLDGITNDKVKDRQKRIFAQARNRADAFEDLLRSTMDELASTVDKSLRTLATSSWKNDDGDEFASNALRMRAANKMYEDKLLQVKALREEIAELQASRADSRRLATLVSEVAKAVSVASLYANEVYGSDGGTVHAVIAVQRARGQEKKNKAANDAGTRSGETGVTVTMASPEQWHQAFTDNLGDVLKDYQHYGRKHGRHEPDYRYAAFKMGKYVDRMVDAARQLGASGLISPEDHDQLMGNRDLAELANLAACHVKAKASEGGRDPKTLVDDPFFKDQQGREVDGFAASAIRLASTVRAMVANHKPVPIGPELPVPATKNDAPPIDGPAVARAKGTGPGAEKFAALQAMVIAAQAAHRSIDGAKDPAGR